MRFEFSEPHRWLRSALAVAAVLCLALVTVLSVSSFAQQISGDITGTALDEQGLGVPNATVEATNNATGVKTSTKANDKGEYHLSNLPVGTYNLSASASNFGTTSLKGIVVDLNKTTTANLTLKVGGVETTVEVTGVAPLIDTTTAQLQSTYDAMQTQMLPVAAPGAIGAGVLNLSLLSAGVTQADSVGLGSGPSVGGLRPRANNFTVEGVDNNNKTVTGSLASPPTDAVAEFAVLQNQFNADFGHSSGGQFNTVLKSGTNGFHGSVFEYFENRNLDALDNSFVISKLTSTPRWDNNNYGATFGGPLIKDKLFFFTLFSRQPVGSFASAGAVQTPTAASMAAISAAGALQPCTSPTQEPFCAGGATAPVPINATNLAQFKQFTPLAPAATNDCTYTGTDGKTYSNQPCLMFWSPIGGNGIPTAVPGGTGGLPIGDVTIAAPAFENFMNFVQTFDYNMSPKDQLRGRYFYYSLGAIDTAAQLPVFYTTTPTRVHLTNLSEFHTFGPHLTNELRLGMNRYLLNGPNSGSLTYPGQGGVFPNLTFNDLGSAGLSLGPDSNSPQFTIQDFYQVVDNMSWVKGKHTIKFGGEYREYISPQFFTQRARGDYFWSATEGFLRDLTPDVFGERSSGSLTYYGNNWSLYGFVNDTMKLTPHFTLNLGLRYEYTTTTVGEGNQGLNTISNAPSIMPLGGIYGPLLFNSPRAPKNNWAPRIGIAYSPGKSGNTSIRAGFGTTYDVLYDNIGILSEPPQIGSTRDTFTYTNPLDGPPCVVVQPLPKSTTCPGPGFLTAGALPGGGSGVTIMDRPTAIGNTASWMPPDRKWPVSVQWNLGIQHSFGKAYSLEVRYLGVHAYHMDVQDRVNVLSPVDSTHFLPTYLSRPSQATLDSLTNTLPSLEARDQIDPAFAALGFTNPIVGFVPAGQSKYNGLAVTFNRRFENGLSFQSAYTWSHAFDNSTADFFSTALTPRRPQDFQNVNGDWATSTLDRRHRFTMAVIYDMPYFKNGNWFAKNLIGNWVVAPIYTYESPQFVTVLSRPSDSNLNGDSAPDRTIFNPSGVPGTGSTVTELTNSAGDTVAYLANSPNAQYIVAGAGALATARRNTLPTRPTDNVDLSVVKKFALNERMRFEIGAVASNVFNHPQYIPGSINDVSGFGGTPINFQVTTLTSDFSFVEAGNGAFNKVQKVFSSNSRYMTLTAKFVF